MAGNLPVPQGVEVKLVWGRAGVPTALNILHFSHTIGQTHSQTRADSIDTIYKTALAASGLGGKIASGVSLMRVESRHMDQNSDPWYIGAGAPVLGTSTDHILPMANAFVVTLRTGLRGRSYNGRVYLWGWTELANDANGQIDAASAEQARQFLLTSAANMSSTLQLTAGVLTRWTTPPGSPPNTPPTERVPPIITPISSYQTADLRWDTQRRRAIPGV